MKPLERQQVKNQARFDVDMFIDRVKEMLDTFDISDKMAALSILAEAAEEKRLELYNSY